MTDTQNDGEYLSGTSASDTLGSTHNETTLDGLGGDDTLTSALDYVTVGPDYDGLASLSQIGGGGNDQMTATFTGTQEFMDDFNLNFDLAGGEGDDRLYGIFAPYFEMFASTATTNMVLDGGVGNDEIYATMGYAYNPSIWTTVIAASGGAGDDLIVVDQQPTADLIDLNTVLLDLDLLGGGGADHIIVDLAEGPTDDITRDVLIDGGNGDDTVELTYRFRTALVVTDAFAISGGAGDDSFGVILEAENEEARLALEMDGGTGNDDMKLTFSEGPTSYSAANDLSAVLTGGRGDDTLNFVSDNAVRMLTVTGNAGRGDDTILSDLVVVGSLFDGTTVAQDLAGGRGNDQFSLNVTATGDDNASITDTIDGGSGNDQITTSAVANVNEFFSASVNQVISGGSGSDTISTDISAGGFGSQSAFSFATAVITGGSGSDQIITDIDARGTGSARAKQEIFGGSGNDTLDVHANAISSFGSTEAISDVSGGRGDDDIKVATLAENNMNDSGTGTATHTVLGGIGNDTIDTMISGFGEDRGETFEVISGGRGSDQISVNSDTTGRVSAAAEMEVSGGRGHDVIIADLYIESTFMEQGQSGTSITGDYQFNGGRGNDEILIDLESVTPSDMTAINNGTALADALIEVAGGTGDDTITVTIDGLGGADIDGGSGNDIITVTGGWQNIGGTDIDNTLIGGSGNDTLIAGDSNDRLIGGLGQDRLVAGSSSDGVETWTGDKVSQIVPTVTFASNTLQLNKDKALLILQLNQSDTFVFDHQLDQGEIHITDWQRSVDNLEFGAITKAELLSFGVLDLGLGADVVVTTTGGTEIYFENAGTGSITTVMDLVDDPSQFV